MDSPWAIFDDRADAGRQLAARLLQFRDDDPVVLALPRGGVPVGYEVARALHAPLDVALARKIGAPFQPELGLGAVAPGGVRVLDEALIRALGLTPEQLEPTIRREQEELDRRSRLFRGDRPPVALEGKTAIIVDDGLATGGTARAVIQWLRTQNPKAIVLAVPVCAAETARSIAADVDVVVCVEAPYDFRAVGLWYRDFDQTPDEEVVQLLRRAAKAEGADRADERTQPRDQQLG